jgi:hypothetical protein
MPPPTVQAQERALRQAGKELGIGVAISKDGLITLSGRRLDLPGLNAEDASLVLSRLKQYQQDRGTLLNFFEGCV